VPVVIDHGLAERNVKLWRSKVNNSVLIGLATGAGAGFVAKHYGKLPLRYSLYLGLGVFGAQFLFRTVPAYKDLKISQLDLSKADNRN